MVNEFPMTLDKEALVTLSHLKTVTPELGKMSDSLKKHHKKSEGRCWMDMLMNSGMKGRWPTVKVVRDRFSESLNPDVKFHVWLVDPWMVHIEMTEEEDGWTAQEVLSLPNWFMVGGTVEKDALSCGYSEESLKRIMLYNTDSNSRMSGSSTEVVKSSDSVSAYIQHLVETDPDNLFDTLRNDISKIGELSRVDMEIIASVSNCLCFSACVSSSNEFKADIMSGTNFGDTIETWRRFIDNETYKVGSNFLKEKRLYFNTDHISRYDFDGAHKIKISKIHSVLEECWKYKEIPLEYRDKKDQSLKRLLAFANKKEKYNMILTDIKTRFDIVFPGDMVESGVELATVGSIIFTVQPFYHPLANLASMQLAATRMFSSVKTISPNILISLINEEADRQKVQKSHQN